MTFNVSQFSAKMSKGLAKNNLFAATVYSPRSMNLEIEADLLFLCKSASIPAMSIETVPVKHQGWGKTDMMPSTFNKENVSLTFMVDSNFAVQQFFHRWLQTVMNYNELNGPHSQDIHGKKLPYEMNYKSDYSGTVEVLLYASNDSSANSPTYNYRFGEAFPVTISGVETSWENNAEIMTMTVSFAYSSISVSGMGETTSSQRALNPPSVGISSGGNQGIISGATPNASGFFSSSGNIQAEIDGILSPINKIVNTGNDFISSLKRVF